MSGRNELFESLLRNGIKSLKKTLQESVDPITDAVTAPAALPPVEPPVAMQPPPTPPAAASPTPDAPPAQTASETGQQPEITVDTIIDKLNTIRSGKSFNDAEVYGQLTTMFKNMQEPEKTTLDKLLGQIGQVVIPAPQVQQSPVVPPQAPPAPQTASPPPPATPPPPSSPQGPVG